MVMALTISVCLDLAAKIYNVRQAEIETVLSAPAQVGGVGPMHIPAAWLPVLARIGFAPAQVETDDCVNIEAGTWILAFEALHEKQRQKPVPPAPPSPIALSQRACIARAAKTYHVPETLLMAVLRTEGGQVGKIHENANGSYDMGPAQINSIWLPVLAKSGISRQMVLNDPCLNITIGAWILGQSMQGANPQNPAAFWRHVGDYNSHTPLFNHQYALKVWANLR